MTKNEHEIIINRPIEQVFGFVTDLENWRHWHPGLQKAEKTTSGPVELGTTWQVSGEVQGRPMAMSIEVTGYEPNRQFGFKTTVGPIRARQSFAFTPDAGGTRINVVLELEDPEIARHARRQWENDLATLKKLLEGA